MGVKAFVVLDKNVRYRDNLKLDKTLLNHHPYWSSSPGMLWGAVTKSSSASFPTWKCWQLFSLSLFQLCLLTAFLKLPSFSLAALPLWRYPCKQRILSFLADTAGALAGAPFEPFPSPLPFGVLGASFFGWQGWSWSSLEVISGSCSFTLVSHEERRGREERDACGVCFRAHVFHRNYLDCYLSHNEGRS